MRYFAVLTMMHKTLFFTFGFFTLLFSCSGEQKKTQDEQITIHLKTDSAVYDFQRQLLKKEVDSIFSKYHFNASVGIFTAEKLLYRRDNGVQNFENKIEMNAATIFAIASISKQFTAVLLLLLEEQGKLKTEDKVALYLDNFKQKKFKNITVHQLLNHTSGISDFGDGLLSAPGKEFHYSNEGYRLLGEIIEKVSGKSYDENVTALFKRVGMHHSFTAKTFKKGDFASAYTVNHSEFKQVKNMPLRLAEKAISVPAGGILSSVEDLHRWNETLYSGQVLTKASLKKMTIKSAERNHAILGKMDYGFGLMMSTQKPTTFFHSGYVKGAPSLLLYYPESKTSVIILSNVAEVYKGKKAVFQPHLKIKKIADSLENRSARFRRDFKEKLRSVAQETAKS